PVRLRIEIGKPPDLLAVAQAMSRCVVVAVNNQVCVLAIVPDEWRGIGMLVFEAGVVLALHFPDVLAGRLVKRDDPVAARVQEDQVQLLSLEHRSVMEAMLNLVFSIAVLSVELPDFLALEVEAGEIAAGHRGIHMRAIGAWRGGSGIPLAAHEPAIAAAELSPPELLAFGANAQENEIIACRAGKKDTIAPDGWR